MVGHTPALAAAVPLVHDAVGETSSLLAHSSLVHDRTLGVLIWVTFLLPPLLAVPFEVSSASASELASDPVLGHTCAEVGGPSLEIGGLACNSAFLY